MDLKNSNGHSAAKLAYESPSFQVEHIEIEQGIANTSIGGDIQETWGNEETHSSGSVADWMD